MNELLILGPHDRYNYGDLLFPYIIEYEIGNKFDSIIYLSTTEADLSDVGGRKCLSIKYLEKLSVSKNYTLIVAGGESLFTGWHILSSYLSPNFRKVLRLFSYTTKIKNCEILYHRIFNYIGRKYLNGKSYLPLSVALSEFKQIEKICYNSLGGSAMDSKLYHALKFNKIFNDISYLSVRDYKTFALLQDDNIKATLIPDSAILMSKYFSCDFLETKISNDVKYFAKENKYIFFQVSKHLGLLHLDVIVQQIESLFYDKGMMVCLCPAGLALGHEDQVALSKISSKLKVPHIFFEKVTIWDIMFLIAKSNVYVGTSLHGAITAMSFVVPYVGLHIEKMGCYLQTWAVKGLDKKVDFENMNSAIDFALNCDVSELNKNLACQFALVEESFKRMLG